MHELDTYKRHERELAACCHQAAMVTDKLASYLVQLAMYNHFTTRESVLKQQVQKLQLERKQTLKKHEAETALLESKIELHKKSLAFLNHNNTDQQQQMVAPSSITSNKLLKATTSFSTTPYLQKITAIKQSRVTPLNGKIQQLSNFTTSTPDVSAVMAHGGKKSSPLRSLINHQRKHKRNGTSIFDQDTQVEEEEEEVQEDDKKYKKIKLKSHKTLDDTSDNDDEPPAPSQQHRNIFDKDLSPLKTNNIFKVI